MTIWIPYKAPPGDRQKNKKNTNRVKNFPDLCRICGKPVKNGRGDLCKSCRDFVASKKNEERKDNK